MSAELRDVTCRRILYKLIALLIKKLGAYLTAQEVAEWQENLKTLTK